MVLILQNIIREVIYDTEIQFCFIYIKNIWLCMCICLSLYVYINMYVYTLHDIAEPKILLVTIFYPWDRTL